MVELNTEVNQRKPCSGMRVLIAVAMGVGLGLAVAYFLKVLIDNSPAEIALGRLRLFYLMVITVQVITVGWSIPVRCLISARSLIALIMSARATWGSWFRSPLLGT